MQRGKQAFGKKFQGKLYGQKIRTRILSGSVKLLLAVRNLENIHKLNRKPEGMFMATKTPYYNNQLPTLRFPWALKVSDFNEILLISGHPDVKPDNSTANFPGDVIGQKSLRIYSQIYVVISTSQHQFDFDEALTRDEPLNKS